MAGTGPVNKQTNRHITNRILPLIGNGTALETCGGRVHVSRRSFLCAWGPPSPLPWSRPWVPPSPPWDSLSRVVDVCA